MVRNHHWYDPVLMRRMRISLTVMIYAVWLIILALQYNWVMPIIKNLF